jgi:hypothetical protein
VSTSSTPARYSGDGNPSTGAPNPAFRLGDRPGTPRASSRSMGRHAPKLLVGLLVIKAALALIATSGC